MTIYQGMQKGICWSLRACPTSLAMTPICNEQNRATCRAVGQAQAAVLASAAGIGKRRS